MDSHVTPTQAPQNTPQRMNRQRAFYRQIPWLSVILSVTAQLLIWWVYPLIYSKELSAGQWQHNPALMTYSVFLALTIFFTFNRRFVGWLNYLFLVIPFLLLYFLYREMTIQQLVLLILLPIALVAIHLKWLNLQNIFGLILFSGLSTLSLPVVIFYQQNTFLTKPFLISLMPLLLSYLFYMTIIFIPDGKKKRLTALVFGIMLLLTILSLPWNIWTLIALIILIATWMIFINLDLKQRYRMTFFTILQAATILLIFMQQAH
ncbi:hypothetical protein [Weissella diestrammenae]|uniref:hypothetical protein n=1 Tax=Weissella diestrammenae TaxID=1162633 RepID=UPI001FAB9A4D|nr:hypothetical protein [Weissella diestrammenae]